MLGTLDSQFEDRHNGVYFKILFFKYPNGYMTEVHVDGLPVTKDDDNCWRSKDDAREASVKVAQKLINNA